MTDLQKAPYAGRMFAFLADLIAASILIVGVYFIMSAALHIDRYSAKYDEIVASYGEKYGVEFGLTQEEYDALSESGQKNYKDAVDAVNSDAEANKAIKTAYTLIFITFSVGFVIAAVLLEFVVPLILKDGRTLGKRLFGLGVMRTDSVKVTPQAVFVRNVIGKGIMEFLIPLFFVLTAASGITGVFGIIAVVALLIAEIVVFFKSGSNRLLHDIIANTVVVEWQSQLIFDSEEAKDKYILSRRDEMNEREKY